MSRRDARAGTTIDPGPLAAFAADALTFATAPQTLPAGLLANRWLTERLIGRLQLAHACRDRPAAASLWSQLYFGKLVIAGVSATLACGHALPLALDTTRVFFCPATGTPLVFHLDASANAVPPSTLLDPLVHGHLAPLVALLRRQFGLSARLLWENAGWVLVWSLGEAARLQPVTRAPADRLLCSLADAGAAPLAAMARAALDGRPLRRRVCCLRYRVPGFEPCVGLCPLGPDATQAMVGAARNRTTHDR